MNQPQTGTVHLYRVLQAPAERIYRAFLDPDALARWLPPFGYVGKVHEMDARVGGGCRMSFTNHAAGTRESFGGTYLELKPNELIRHTDRCDNPGMPGEMVVTVKLREVACGTELDIVQEGIPAVIPVESCYIGWQQTLSQLAQLVEAQTHDNP